MMRDGSSHVFVSQKLMVVMKEGSQTCMTLYVYTFESLHLAAV